MGDVGGGVCTGESVGGGTDVWSSSGPAAADHLVVMVHGILGSMFDSTLSNGIQLMVAALLTGSLQLTSSERNMYGLTLDGVDVMGERLAEEGGLPWRTDLGGAFGVCATGESVAASRTSAAAAMVLRIRTARDGFGVQDGSFVDAPSRVPALLPSREIGLVFTGTVGWDPTEDVATIEGVMSEVCSLEVFGDAVIRNSIFLVLGSSVSASRIPLVSIRSFAVQSKIAASPIRRFSSFSRVPVELGCWGGSLFPLHSAVAEGKLTSQLSSASRSARALSQGFVGRACPGP
ncbi:hypothetical protein MUK42_34164 [Musa troglodytarum]|uniref:DUF676 domain-containing protein n=1 Tax=Musa troglodytarum TaxID=320322 RepID=A0A9E7FLE6_9LILI|nr:hypothetical protein MUK42_34164 [Musa troglodytarum]